MSKQNMRNQIKSTNYCRQAEESNDFGFICNEEKEQNTGDTITLISVDRLIEYKDRSFESIAGRPQPFLEYTKEALDDLIESIREHGIINPVVVRNNTNGKYQILAGRNRVKAAKKVGLEKVPAIIKIGISDDEAILIMLESNLKQRQNLLYSERAYAYKMKLDVENRQGKRNDIESTSCTQCTRLDTLSEMGKQNKESRRMVAYLIRLTYLLPRILKLIDDRKMPYKVGVSLSYLSVDAQAYLLKNIIPKCKIKLAQAEKLRKLQDSAPLTEEAINEVFCQNETEVAGCVKISKERLTKFPELLADEKKLEDLFIRFLEEYSQGRKAV